MSGAEEDKKMPLLEHLIELRTRCSMPRRAFVVAFLGCYFVAQPIFDFLLSRSPIFCMRWVKSAASSIPI